MSRWALILALVLGPVPPAAAQSLSADLSSHFVAITTGFTGTSVILFGATDGAGEVVAVVRGPERRIVVRRKRRVAGIWLNAAEAAFDGVPSFYAVYASRALDAIASPATRALHQIGLDNLRFEAPGKGPADLAAFRAALFDEQERQGLFAKAAGRIAFLGDRLFRADIRFPADVPVGTYLVEILLIRDKMVVAGQTTPLVVSQSGVAADVYEFAQRRALLYGLLAAAGAALAGWLASLPFRNA